MPAAPLTSSGGSPGEFTVVLSQPAPVDVAVGYSVGGTAVAGIDYTTIPATFVDGVPTGQVVVPEGQTTAEVEVHGLSGGAAGDKTVTIWCSGAYDASQASTYPRMYYPDDYWAVLSLPTVTIAPPALPQLTVSDAVCNEGDSETFKVLLSRTDLLDGLGLGAVYFSGWLGRAGHRLHRPLRQHVGHRHISICSWSHGG